MRQAANVLGADVRFLDYSDASVPGGDEQAYHYMLTAVPRAHRPESC